MSSAQKCKKIVLMFRRPGESREHDNCQDKKTDPRSRDFLAQSHVSRVCLQKHHQLDCMIRDSKFLQQLSADYEFCDSQDIFLYCCNATCKVWPSVRAIVNVFQASAPKINEDLVR